MSATILSFDTASRGRKVASEHQEFHELFNKTHELTSLHRELKIGEIATMDWSNLEHWFQCEIAREVFHKHLFQRSILVSISFVAALLSLYARNHVSDISITEHVAQYSASGAPDDMLKAANCAFYMFVFSPEERLGRSVKYRKLANDVGPALYANYASMARKNFAFHMADAFLPLGTIARERFVRG